MNFFDKVRGFFGFGKQNKETIPAGTIEKEFDARPAASRKMQDGKSLWYRMYTNDAPWLNCDVISLDLPGKIGLELARNALTEFSIEVSGSARADYINEQIQRPIPKFTEYLQLGLCLGGVAMKPYPDSKGRILLDAFTTKFEPTQFDGTGKCIGGVFESEPVRQGKDWFVKLEYHDFQTQDDGSVVYVVENKAFRSGSDGGIGAQVPLASVKEWAQLDERQVIGYLDGPLFAYFKPPMANQEDPNSPLGVSVYSGAVKDLIRQADKQWERIWWEFDSGERKIFADGDIEPGQVKDRLFVKGMFTGEGNLFEQFSPEYRNTPLYEGFQYILKIIEFNVGLAFGTISDPQSVNKTATEEIMTKHRQYVTEDSIQKAFQSTLDDLIYAMWALCDLAQLAPAGEYEVDYNWGDGILDDPETRRQDMAMDIQRVNAGLMSRKQFFMKWDKVDEETALQMLADMDELVTEPEEEIE